MFIALVCKRFDELGAPKAEIEKQRVYIKKYLDSLGIGEVSAELDGEDPVAFADEIFKIIKARGLKNKEEAEPVPIDPPAEIETLGQELEEESSYGDLVPEDGTREFSISDVSSETSLEEQEAFEKEEYYQTALTGNPVFFWILTVILSPLWLTVAALFGIGVVVLYILLSVFVILYVPFLILLILGGSAGIIAELIYSIVKFVAGEIHIGLFELGLGFALAAAVISLSVLIYRFGTKYAPKIRRGYFGGVSRLFKRIKKVVRRLREVCSI